MQWTHFIYMYIGYEAETEFNLWPICEVIETNILNFYKKKFLF